MTHDEEMIKEAPVDRALYNAILAGDLDAAKIQLSLGANPNAPMPHPLSKGMFAMRCETALTMAVRNYNLDAVALLGPTADANLELPGGMLPIVYAAGRGGASMVRALIDIGADPRIADEYGSTALLEASFRGYADIAKIVGALSVGGPPALARDGSDALMLACALTDEEHALAAARSSLAASDPTHANEEGRTALMIAAARGHGAVVAFLLMNKADPAAVDPRGMTALDLSLGEARHVLEAHKAMLDQAREMEAFVPQASVAKRPGI